MLQKQLIGTKELGTVAVPVGDITVVPRTGWYALAPPSRSPKAPHAPSQPPPDELRLTVTAVLAHPLPAVVAPPCAPWRVPATALQMRRTLDPRPFALNAAPPPPESARQQPRAPMRLRKPADGEEEEPQLLPVTRSVPETESTRESECESECEGTAPPGPRLAAHFFVAGLPTSLADVERVLSAAAARAWDAVPLPLAVLGVLPPADADTVPAEIGALLVPDGARLAAAPCAPAVYPVVTTDCCGRLHYATCLRVAEALDARTAAAVAALVRRTRAPGAPCPAPGTPLYFPKCYCVVGSTPATLPLHRRWLAAFHDAARENATVARRMVCALLAAGAAGAGKDAGVLEATLFGQRVARVAARSTLGGNGRSGVPVAGVVARLGPGVVAELFGALLQQASVMLVSDSVTRLTGTALALRALLHPLDWCFAFVPVCPGDQVVPLLQSPQAVLFGVTRAAAAALADHMDTLVCCDLDDGLLVLPPRAVPAAAALPPRDFALLLRDLAWVTAEGGSSSSSSGAGEADAEEDEDGDEGDSIVARAPFLRFFLRTLADLPLFLDYVRIAGVRTPIAHLDKARFIAAHEQRARAQCSGTSDALCVAAFLDRFLGSQALANFVDTFSVTRPTLFNRLLMSRRAAALAQTAPIAEFVAEVRRVQHVVRSSSPSRVVRIDLTPSGVARPSPPPSKSQKPDSGGSSFGPFAGLLCPLPGHQQGQEAEKHKRKQGNDEDEDEDEPAVDAQFCRSAAEYLSARNRELQQAMHDDEAHNERHGKVKRVAARFWGAVFNQDADALPQLVTTMEQLVARETGRRYLAQSYATEKQLRGGQGARTLPQDVYAAVVRIFNRALSAASQQKDFVTPCALIGLLQEFQCSTPRGEEALANQVKGDKYLSKNILWENYFYANADRALRGPTVYGTSDSLAAVVLRRCVEGTSAEHDRAAAEKEQRELFSVLGQMVYPMVTTSVPTRIINSVTMYISTVVRLPRKFQRELQIIIANLSGIELAKVLELPDGSDAHGTPGAYAADTWTMIRNIHNARTPRRPTPGSLALSSGIDAVLLQSSTVHLNPGGSDDADPCPCLGPTARLKPVAPAASSSSSPSLSPVLSRRDSGATTALVGVALPPQLQHRSAEDAKACHLTVLRGHTAPVLCVVGCSTSRLVSAGCDATVCVWDVSTRRTTSPAAVLRPRHTGWVNCLHVCRGSSTTLLAGSYDATVSVSDLAMAQCVATLRGHEGALTCLAAPLPDDGTVALSGAADGKAVLWDLRTARASVEYDGRRGPVTCAAWLGDSVFATGCGDSVVRLWDVRERRLLTELHGHGGSVTALAVVPPSCTSTGRTPRLLVSASTDGTVVSWDTARLHAQPPPRQRLVSVQAHRGPVHALAYSGVHGCVASGGADGSVRVWDPALLVLQHDLPGHAGDVTAVAPFRHYFASSGADHTTRFWNPKAGSSSSSSSAALGNKRRSGPAPRAAPAPVAAAPVGEAAAAAAVTADGVEEQCLREACNVYCRRVFAGHSAGVSALCTIDDKIVATAGWDATVQYTVWE